MKHKVTFFNQSIGLWLKYQQQGGLTPEQLDDELELKTGCRLGDPAQCKCPDCKHNQNNPPSPNGR